MSRNFQQDTSEMNVLFVHSAVDDYPLTPEEFRVYAHLARRAGLGEAWPKIESIAKICRVHPDTARRCIQALTAYGMINAKERRGRTNLYTITRLSNWKPAAQVEALQKIANDAGKARRDAAKVRRVAKKEEEKATSEKAAASGIKTANPSETKGGVVNEGTPSERREATPLKRREGYPSVTEGDEGDPLKLIPVKEEEISSRARMSEAAEAPPPSGPFTAALEKISSSSLSPAALEQPDQAQPETGNDAAPAQRASTEREGQSPSGEAAPVLAFTEKDLDDLLPLESGNDQALQDVPGAAGGVAAAEVPPSGPDSPPLPARVLEFAPLPAPELESRLPALPVSEPYQRLVDLLGEKDLPVMLREKTRSGGLPRERWLLLHLAEIRAVETVANAEHAATGTSLRTLVARGLDRLIGSPWTGQKKPTASIPVIGGHSLEPAKKPELEPETPEEGKLKPGAQYRRKADDALVELVKTERVKNKFGDGEKWVLSDGSLVGALDLVLKFEFVGRSA